MHKYKAYIQTLHYINHKEDQAAAVAGVYDLGLLPDLDPARVSQLKSRFTGLVLLFQHMLDSGFSSTFQLRVADILQFVLDALSSVRTLPDPTPSQAYQFAVVVSRMN